MQLTRKFSEIRRNAIKKGDLTHNIRVVLFTSCKANTPASFQLSYKTLVRGHPELCIPSELSFPFMSCSPENNKICVAPACDKLMFQREL
jgi:hypothetical protein